MKKKLETFESFIEGLTHKTPKHWKYFELAFVHSSYANENNLTQNNERLEFLGDAVLGLCVGELLMKHFPDYPEGKLSRFRAMLVNERSLCEISKKMNLGEWVKLGKGEAKAQGKNKPSILSDLFEAFVGALYMSFGFLFAKAFLEKLLLPLIVKVEITSDQEDYKSQLQEYAQKNFNLIPSYTLMKESGPDHAKIFTVGVSVGNKTMGIGKANSKKKIRAKSCKTGFAKT